MSETNLYFDEGLKQWVISNGNAIIAIGGSALEALRNYKNLMSDEEEYEGRI